MGTSTIIKVSSDGINYETVANGYEVERVFTGVNSITTVFGNQWVNRRRNLKEGKYTINCFYFKDSAGQDIIENAYLTGASFTVAILLDGDNGFKQDVLVDRILTSTNVKESVKRAFSLSSVGVPVAITYDSLTGELVRCGVELFTCGKAIPSLF